MAIDVIIKQSGFFKKTITPQLFHQFLANKFQFGVPNSAFVLDSEDNVDLTKTSVVIYNPSKIGRGFTFWLSKNQKECYLTLNIPSTTQDVIDFYQFIQSICTALGVKHFTQDDSQVKLVDITDMKNNILNWNTSELKQSVEQHPGLMILGAQNPIWIEEQEFEHMKTLDGEILAHYFEKYLDSKQHHDYYYMKPNFYSTPEGETMGAYSLTETVTSIVPLTPYVTFNCGLEFDTPIDKWIIAIFSHKDNDFNVEGYISYQDLNHVINLEQQPAYDRRHVIIELNNSHIEQLRPYFQNM